MPLNKSPAIICIFPALFRLTPQTKQEPSLKTGDDLLLETVLFEGF